MAKALNTKPWATGFTLGRNGFARISTVEGIRLSAEVERKFADFDRKGLTAPKRGEAIARDDGRSR